MAIIRAIEVFKLKTNFCSMSQEEIYKILKSLGGQAALAEIKEMAKKKFPRATLYMYAKKRLLQLEKYGIVQEVKTEKGLRWKIFKEY